MASRRLQDIDVNGEKIIMRVDFNVPLDSQGNIVDSNRITITLPTIRYLLENGASQIILITHMGRPKAREEKLKTDKVAQKLGDLLNTEVQKVDDWGENGLPEAKIVILENLRFNPGEKDKDFEKRKSFGKQLASLADVYVNEAFSNCHRDHASMTSIPLFIPGCLGMNVTKEVDTLIKDLENPERPFIMIIGGVKADKVDTIANMIKKADKILVAGAVAFLLLEEKGIPVGDTKIDKEELKKSREDIQEMLKNKKIILPEDAVIADKFEENATSKVVSVNEIPEGWMALDIGPKTVEHYTTLLKEAKTIVWTGPIGVFEWEQFGHGTRLIADCIIQSEAKSILAGGDSVAAATKLGIKDKLSFVSSGGGSALKVFEGKTLVALKALEKNAEQFSL